MEIINFCLSERGMSAQTHTYTGYRTADGIHLEYYIGTDSWDGDGYAESRNVIRKIDGGEDVLCRLNDLFEACRIQKWAGFCGSNPSGTLDGSSMSFEAVLADGTKISASGTNNFPKNYHEFAKTLHRLMTSEKISDTEFTEGTYAVTLPESWVGRVTAGFSEGFVTFSVDRSDGSELTFFIIDNDSCGYSSPSYRGREEVGRLVFGDDVRFITARDHDSIASYANRVSGEVLALLESYNDDRAAIIKSIRGVNGYKFCAEDGMTLYMSEAMTLADSARSLWLSLNFAGDYPGGSKPITLKRRQYIQMFPSYTYTDTIEDVRRKFLKVFSEEFTERTLKHAVAEKSLIEYRGSVYVLCKKSKGEVSRNSYVDSVWDEGNGKFTVVMAVGMPSAEDVIYVSLPVGKNAEGRFVFTDYPYWDKSE